MSEAPINVEEEAQAVADLLREYAAKLTDYNLDALAFLEASFGVGEHTYGRFAWMLDRFEMINRPLQRILSRGSGLLEHSALMPRTKEEMNLRLRELESQLHHAERRVMDLNAVLGSGAHAKAVAQLRYAAGLPADRNAVAKRA